MAIRKSSTNPRKTSGAAASKPRAARARATTNDSGSGASRSAAATPAFEPTTEQRTP